MALPYPHIDPIALEIGPLIIRWYALAYLAGLLLGWWQMRRQVRRPPFLMTETRVDDLLVWMTFGIILGGRLGYVLFYNFSYYISDPLAIFVLWKGGMSFHGGALGVIVVMWLFSRRHKLSFLMISDSIARLVPIGLFFGRIANFINGELFGREAPDAEWAMVFPTGGPIPRHPSQLYEAVLEGAVLFVLLAALARLPFFQKRPGSVASAFLIGYGLARFVVEFYRQPDAQLGFLFAGATMGQLLSVPMILVGLALLFFLPKNRTAS